MLAVKLLLNLLCKKHELRYQQKQVRRELRKNKNLFPRHAFDLGRIDAPELHFDIKLKPGADDHPVSHKPRKFPTQKRKQLEKLLRGLEEAGYIEEGDPNAKWVSSLLAVANPGAPNGEITAA